MKKNIVFFFVLNFSILLFSQQILTYKGSGNYTLRERTDLRRYENGKYIGLVSREVTSFIIPVSSEDGYLYEGNFFISEDTVHYAKSVGIGLKNAIPSTFRINSDGNIIMIEDNGFPSFRSFPTYPQKEIKIGDTWTGKAERAVDPLYKGIITKMPIYVQYKYIGDEYYHDEPVLLLSAQWATRYGMGTGNYYIDFGGDKDLEKATGSHKATIYVSKITGNMIVVRDSVDETFFYKDGKSVQFKGTISLFTEYPPSYEKEQLLPSLKRICEITDEQIASNKTDITTAISSNQIKVEQTLAGIRLSIQNLQFKADSSELLPGEEERLDQIAEVLKTVPNQFLLVEGHTASTGNPIGEKELSLERARAIANALVKRGIKSDLFICKGFGGTKPIADNNTTEGKALNRRVEITILD